MKNSLLIILIGMSTCMTLAQSHTLDQSNSQLSINGTSSLHDWASVVEKFDASADLSGMNFTNVSFEATVKSIRSGKSGMDKNIYSALAADNNPKIIFTSEKLTIKGNKLTGTGILTIKGNSNNIDVDLDIQEKDSYVISGHFDMKMTDYGVSPPTAIFGTVKTGDDISLDMVFVMKKK